MLYTKTRATSGCGRTKWCIVGWIGSTPVARQRNHAVQKQRGRNSARDSINRPPVTRNMTFNKCESSFHLMGLSEWVEYKRPTMFHGSGTSANSIGGILHISFDRFWRLKLSVPHQSGRVRRQGWAKRWRSFTRPVYSQWDDCMRTNERPFAYNHTHRADFQPAYLVPVAQCISFQATFNHNICMYTSMLCMYAFDQKYYVSLILIR